MAHSRFDTLPGELESRLDGFGLGRLCGSCRLLLLRSISHTTALVLLEISVCGRMAAFFYA